jgi:hypothetical protein
MGCCVSNDGGFNDIPFEEIEEYNKLKMEMNQILDNKDKINQTDNDELLEIINKISLQIARSEEAIGKLKPLKRINAKFINEQIQEINSKINDLKEYSFTLNNQIKKNKNEIQLKENINDENLSNELQKDENTLLRGNKKNMDINNNDELEKGKNDIKLNNFDKIYFKKYIRRNKRSDNFNKTTTQHKYNNSHIISYNSLDNDNYYNNNYLSTTINEKNKINIIFVLENGKKITIQNEAKDKFIDAITKLGEIEKEYNNLENMIIFDKDNNITERVKNGEIISSFGFNDYHSIQIKLIPI